MVTFTTKGNMTIAKKSRKIVAFCGFQNGSFFYAFGKPSQTSYMSFCVDSIDTAKNRILENV